MSSTTSNCPDPTMGTIDRDSSLQSLLGKRIGNLYANAGILTLGHLTDFIPQVGVRVDKEGVPRFVPGLSREGKVTGQAVAALLDKVRFPWRDYVRGPLGYRPPAAGSGSRRFGVLEYRVIEDEFLSGLVKKTTKAAAQGWRPQGGICVAHTDLGSTQFPNHYRFRLTYLQAMVREKHQTGDE